MEWYWMGVGWMKLAFQRTLQRYAGKPVSQKVLDVRTSENSACINRLLYNMRICDIYVKNRQRFINDQIQKIMISELSEKFLQDIENDQPRVALHKYRGYIKKNQKSAMQIVENMLKLSIDSKLIGQYERIYGILKMQVKNTPEYRAIRDIMTSKANLLINDAATHEESLNNSLLGPAYHQVAKLYFQYAEYQDCFLYYKRLYKVKDCTVAREEYYTQFAICLYFLDDFGELVRFHRLTLEKSFMETNIDYCIVKDIKALHTNCKLPTSFKTVLDYEFNIHQVMKNRVMSSEDFGFLFSMVCLAFRVREELNSDVSWSGQLQQLYLRKLYKKIIEKVRRQREIKCFLPIFDHIYQTCISQIEIRIFSDVVQSFQRCPYTLLHKLTGITETQGLLLIKKAEYYKLPVLIDPVSCSFVFRRDVLPLYKEVKMLYKKLEYKFNSEARDRLKEQEYDMLSSVQRTFGGLGGMGGMGRRKFPQF